MKDLQYYQDLTLIKLHELMETAAKDGRSCILVPSSTMGELMVKKISDIGLIVTENLSGDYNRISW